VLVVLGEWLELLGRAVSRRVRRREWVVGRRHAWRMPIVLQVQLGPYAM
jgi:hypothetical protein